MLSMTKEKCTGVFCEGLGETAIFTAEKKKEKKKADLPVAIFIERFDDSPLVAGHSPSAVHSVYHNKSFLDKNFSSRGSRCSVFFFFFFIYSQRFPSNCAFPGYYAFMP